MGHSPHHCPPASWHPRHGHPLPLTPPSHAPYLAKGQRAPSPVGSLFALATSTQCQRCTAPATTPFQRAMTSGSSRYYRAAEAILH